MWVTGQFQDEVRSSVLTGEVLVCFCGCGKGGVGAHEFGESASQRAWLNGCHVDGKKAEESGRQQSDSALAVDENVFADEWLAIHNEGECGLHAGEKDGLFLNDVVGDDEGLVEGYEGVAGVGVEEEDALSAQVVWCVWAGEGDVSDEGVAVLAGVVEGGGECGEVGVEWCAWRDGAAVEVEFCACADGGVVGGDEDVAVGYGVDGVFMDVDGSGTLKEKCGRLHCW